MTRRLTLLLLVFVAGCDHTPRHKSPGTSELELRRLTAALDKAMTQTEMNLASKKISEFWDAKLILAENRIEEKPDNKARKRFLESKNYWRTYRLQEVKFRADFFAGGSIQPLIVNTSHSQITEHRVRELESILGVALERRHTQ